MITKIGIIGTGMLGNAVGLHLLKSNFDLTVYNRTKEKTKELENKGAKVCRFSKRSSREFRINNNSCKRCQCSKRNFFWRQWNY